MKYTTLSAAVLAALPLLSQAQTATLPVVEVTASPVIEENRFDRFGALVTTVSNRQIEDMNAVDAAAGGVTEVSGAA